MNKSSDASDDPITDINVTPLVDVSLVLVIIFMAVAPFILQAGITVLRSSPSVTLAKKAASENVQIRLTQKGKLTVNQQPTSWENLSSAIQKALRDSRDKMVILTADDKNRVEEVVKILDTSKQVGAAKLAIMNQP
ncbi:MAG: biopolymer transporter ExbD [Elusimicrobia bacterium]|nr:biopolymer transporter ExbD [Elusimicrobiota bacterium]